MRSGSWSRSADRRVDFPRVRIGLDNVTIGQPPRIQVETFTSRPDSALSGVSNGAPARSAHRAAAAGFRVDLPPTSSARPRRVAPPSRSSRSRIVLSDVESWRFAQLRGDIEASIEGQRGATVELAADDRRSRERRITDMNAPAGELAIKADA